MPATARRSTTRPARSSSRRTCDRTGGAGRLPGRAGAGAGAEDADPITTEIIRHGLNSAANQIKRSLIRTSFSLIIYEVLDFAAVVYDRQYCMLAQAPSLPFFMGTMSCIEAAVDAVGGED